MHARVEMRMAWAVGLVIFASDAYTMRLPSHDLLSLSSRAASVCPTSSNLMQCGQGLPSNFCCDLSSTDCLVLDDGAGAVCCPKNPDGSPGNCQTMSPIDGGCNADAYNATLFPTSPIHLKNIPSTFATCGGQGSCCPPGYSCSGEKCVTQNSTSASSTGAAAAATSAAAVTLSSAHAQTAPTTAASEPQSTTAQANSDASSNTSPGAQSNPFPPIAILTGLFPGIVAGALLTFLVVICIGRRHRNRQEEDDSPSDLGSIRAKVSDPIYHDDGTGRTDFLRRNVTSQSGSSRIRHTSEATLSPALSRVRSLFSRQSPSTTPRGLGVGVDTPRTPERGLKREPSTESITIFSPPDMRGVSHDRATTYSDVMRAAGAGRSEPMLAGYMGSPGMVDPRKRGVDDGQLR